MIASKEARGLYKMFAKDILGVRVAIQKEVPKILFIFKEDYENMVMGVNQSNNYYAMMKQCLEDDKVGCVEIEFESVYELKKFEKWLNGRLNAIKEKL